jgi:hypothetical protein
VLLAFVLRFPAFGAINRRCLGVTIRINDMGMVCYLRPTTDDEIKTLLAEPNRIVEKLSVASEFVELDLSKSWHGLHYLLTGTAWGGEWPGNFLLRGGSDVGDIHFGYGPARVLTSNQVAEINQFLISLSIEQFTSGFDLDQMKRLDTYPYPLIRSGEDDEEEERDILVEFFGSLKAYIKYAYQKGWGIIIYMV